MRMWRMVIYYRTVMTKMMALEPAALQDMNTFLLIFIAYYGFITHDDIKSVYGIPSGLG